MCILRQQSGLGGYDSREGKGTIGPIGVKGELRTFFPFLAGFPEEIT